MTLPRTSGVTVIVNSNPLNPSANCGKAHKADNEIKEKRERIRQLKRDLEDAERRADHGIRRAKTLEQVRARVHALETAVATELTRVTALESSIRVGAG